MVWFSHGLDPAIINFFQLARAREEATNDTWATDGTPLPPLALDLTSRGWELLDQRGSS